METPTCRYNNNSCLGGFPRLYQEIHTLRQEKPDSIVLNAGDSFQGTYWYTLLKWNITQEFMNMIPHDAHVSSLLFSHILKRIFFDFLAIAMFRSGTQTWSARVTTVIFKPILIKGLKSCLHISSTPFLPFAFPFHPTKTKSKEVYTFVRLCTYVCTSAPS